jgi:transposase InsO family protein
VIARRVAEKLSKSDVWRAQAAKALRTANGTPLKVLGMLPLTLRFGKGAEVDVAATVVEDVEDALLLGRDAYKKLEAEISWRRGGLVLPSGAMLPWMTTEEADAHVAKANESSQVDGRARIEQVLANMKDVFGSKARLLGAVDKTRHYIPLTSEVPVVERLRRTSLKQDAIIEKMMREMLAEGVIEKSASEYASPVVLARKKDGSPRFCVDYRKLNAVTRRDPYPLPRMDEILDRLGKARVFSKIDVRNGYWHVLMAEEDRHKTAFITKLGTFQFKRMPFGLSGAPATFQRAMNECLGDAVGKYCLVYLDDVVIYSDSELEHAEHLREVLRRVHEKGFVLKREKCVFGVAQLALLGHIVGHGTLKADPDKIAALKQLAPPKNTKELHSFLGSVGYFRRFIKDFAEKSRPLFALTHLDAEFEWTGERQRAFEELKASMTVSPILQLPIFGKEFVVRTDASDYATGAVLLQEHDGEERPVAYYSKKLGTAEKNYTTTEKEALAVVRAIKSWWFYLDGTKFVIETDHSALQSVLKAKEPSGRIARWVMLLQELDFVVKHRPGRQMQLPDMLSRQERVLAMRSAREAQERDVTTAALRRAVETGEEPADTTVRKLLTQIADRLVVDDGTLFYSGSGRDAGTLRLVVPSEMRRSVLQECHDALTSGHLGREKTFARVRERYWWPDLYKDVKHYVDTCDACQRAKKPKWSATGKWEATVVGAPWKRVAVDFLGPVTRTARGNRYLLVFTDYLTRWVVAVPTQECTAETAAREFVEKIVLQFGAPEELLSDNGQHFAAEVVERVCQMAGTKKLFTTAYRPQADGLVERWNGTLAQMLASSMEDDKDWDEKVPFVVFAYNTAQHAVTGKSPFELVQGRVARLPMDVALGTRPSEQRSASEYSDELLIRMQEGFRAAREAMDQSKRTQERRRLKEGGKEVAYEKGQKAWLLVEPDRITKFGKKFDGPYEIVEVNGPNYATIALEDGEKVKVHVERLKPFKARDARFDEEFEINVGDDSADESEEIVINPEEVEVDPDHDKLLPNDLIGKRVRVHWPLERQWFDGTVKARKKKQHVVHYDDGEVRAERLLGYKKAAPKWKLLERRRSDAISF